MNGVIDRFEGDFFVIKLETGTELLWSRENLPLAQAGDAITLSLVLQKDLTAKREATAKEILNDILKSSN